MSIDNRSLLGALFFVGAAQFILVIVIAEARYPGGYSVATNALSNLGVGLGIIALVATVLLVTGHWLGIGKGGTERMIAYPIFLLTPVFLIGALIKGTLS
ncbi:MAG: hypothetical protein ACLPI9_01000 [Halobacteriota archaeon]|jgi:hypothetical membrane protein